MEVTGSRGGWEIARGGSLQRGGGALTNEDIIALGCITTKAMNTNNIFIFTFVLISHGFLRHGYTVRRTTYIRKKRIGVVVRALRGCVGSKKRYSPYMGPIDFFYLPPPTKKIVHCPMPTETYHWHYFSMCYTHSVTLHR